MDEQSLPLDKVVTITRIKYLILNLYNDPDTIFNTICQLIDEHMISEVPETLSRSVVEDFEADRPFFTSQSALLNRVRLEFGKDRGYVFIDEIQRKENAGI